MENEDFQKIYNQLCEEIKRHHQCECNYANFADFTQNQNKEDMVRNAMFLIIDPIGGGEPVQKMLIRMVGLDALALGAYIVMDICYTEPALTTEQIAGWTSHIIELLNHSLDEQMIPGSVIPRNITERIL